MRISIIVPVLDENAALLTLLGRIPNRTGLEIVVVDGAADAQCRTLCERAGAVYCAVPPGRGTQLRAGAIAATGDILWFLHVDAVPAADAAERIARCIGTGAVGGYFRFRFEGPPNPGKTLLSRLINWRARVGVPYGDQGLFMTRTAYLRAGGFPDEPLFEEVPLVRALRVQGRFEQLAATIGVSERRWKRDGWVRRTLANRVLALGYAAGIAPRRLARWYRPVSRS